MFRFKKHNLRGLKLNRVTTICQITILALLLSGMFTQALSIEPDPRFEVAEYVRDNVLSGEYGDRTIWISSHPVDSSHEARSLDTAEPAMTFPYEGWMVMIDDAPRANWGHNVRWLIVQVDLGAHTTPRMYTFPPRVFDVDGNKIPVTCLEGATGVPCDPPDLKSIKIEGLDIAISDSTNQDKDCLYAVLISGGINAGSNHERYRTNLRSMYTILLSQGYLKSNIFVYYADGAPLDLDNADGDSLDTTGSDVTDSADKSTIRTRLQDLCDDLNPVVDYLFVYVTDHGGSDGAISLWDFDGDGLETHEKYFPAEMDPDTEDCQVCRLFMLHDQCFSGAFLPLATDGNHDNTTVYAAASATESSYGRRYMDWWEDLNHGTTTLEALHQSVVDNVDLGSTPGKNEVDETNDQVLLGDCCVNTPPTADANGPYTEGCQGATTILTLDGTGSSDPDDADTLTYAWTTACPGGTFDDATSPTPGLTVDTSLGCPVIFCNVTLTVTDLSGASDTDTATVTVQDIIPPVIACPADITIECDEPTAPSNTGQATATDNCDGAPALTHSDVETPGACPEEKTITRTWTATDNCGNASSCVQTISVVDTTPPVISCNAPSTIIPPDAPISFTATATDNCDDSPSVEITEFDCFKYTKKGKRIDKTESCVVDVVGDTITILDSGGVEDNITWTVRATDSCGNVAEQECRVVVVNPAQP